MSNYEIIEERERSSNLYIEQKTEQLAPTVNTKTRIRFESFSFYADNVIDFQLGINTTYHPQQSIESYQILFEYYIAFKTTKTITQDSLFSDYAMDVLVDIYQMIMLKIFRVLQESIATSTQGWTVALNEPLRREDCINAIKTALELYLSQQG